MSYDLDLFVDRMGTNSAKWEFMQGMDPEAGPGTLPFWVADMDFPCAEPVLKALHDRVDRQIFGYSSNETGEFFRAVCGWYRHRFGWYVNSADIVYSPGVVPALGYLVDILTSPGDGVIVQKPVYYPFSSTITNHGRKIVNNPLIERDGRYEMDFDDLEKKLADPSAKLMILCSPHNPVGRVWTLEELKRLGKLLTKSDIPIVSDEIHYDLVREGVRHYPLETVLPELKNRIITATAPSKTFNMAGLQLSNIIIHDPAIRKKWNDYVGAQLSLRRPTALSIVAAQSAFAEGEDWLSAVNAYIDENLRFLQRFLRERLPKAKCVTPEGTYLVWIDIRPYGYDEGELVKLIAREGKALVEGGSMFGEEGRGFLRMNVACTRATLEEGLNRVARILGRVRAGDRAPVFRYDTAWKRDVEFSPGKAGGDPSVLVFLRYYGCPLCQLEIRKLAKDASLFRKRGIRLLVVIQSEADKVRESLKEADLPFDLVCDPRREIFRLYNVLPAFRKEDMRSLATIGLVQEAVALGLSHGAYEGEELQLPAAFGIGADGVVTLAHYAKDLADMPSHDELAESASR